MALVDCPECGRRISTLAVACPQCGFPLSREAVEAQGAVPGRGPSRWTDPGFWVIVIGLVVVIILSIVLLRQAGRDAGSETTVPVVTTEAIGPAGPGLLAPGLMAVSLAWPDDGRLGPRGGGGRGTSPHQLVPGPPDRLDLRAGRVGFEASA